MFRVIEIFVIYSEIVLLAEILISKTEVEAAVEPGKEYNGTGKG